VLARRSEQALCHARFSRGWRATGDAPPVRPSVFRRERGGKRICSTFRDRSKTAESELRRGFQRFSIARFRAVA